jgi:hypothetical protein
VRIERQAVCHECWQSAHPMVRQRCQGQDLPARRQAFAELFRHADQRRKRFEQPTLL